VAHTPAGEGPHPVIVMGHGLGAVKEMRLDAYAERFQAAGYACPAFDYRHFGASAGRARPGPRPATGTVDWAIVEVAKANPTDGTRMVAALTSRGIERPVSRKRAQRVMRSERLLQRHRPSGRRRRPATSGSSAATSSGTWT